MVRDFPSSGERIGRPAFLEGEKLFYFLEVFFTGKKSIDNVSSFII
jgi:hypothetical protein